jgi:hypothetical protein
MGALSVLSRPVCKLYTAFGICGIAIGYYNRDYFLLGLGVAVVTAFANNNFALPWWRRRRARQAWIPIEQQRRALTDLDLELLGLIGEHWYLVDRSSGARAICLQLKCSDAELRSSLTRLDDCRLILNVDTSSDPTRYRYDLCLVAKPWLEQETMRRADLLEQPGHRLGPRSRKSALAR